MFHYYTRPSIGSVTHLVLLSESGICNSIEARHPLETTLTVIARATYWCPLCPGRRSQTEYDLTHQKVLTDYWSMLEYLIHSETYAFRLVVYIPWWHVSIMRTGISEGKTDHVFHRYLNINEELEPVIDAFR